MKPLDDAISFVKKTVGSGEVYGAYHFSKNTIWATDIKSAAQCPVRITGTFSVPARELELAVNKLGATDAVHDPDNETLTLRKGKSRAVIQTRPTETFLPKIGGTKLDISDTWGETLKALSDIPDENANALWTTGILALEKSTAVVGFGSNFFMIADEPLLGGQSAIVPVAAAKLLAGSDVPDSAHFQQNSLGFVWEDNRSFSTQLIAGEMPKVAFERLDQARALKDAWEITTEWRESVDRIVSLVGKSGIIIVDNNSLETDKGFLHADEEVETVLEQKVRMRAGVLALISEHARYLTAKRNIWTWSGARYRGMAGIMTA